MTPLARTSDPETSVEAAAYAVTNRQWTRMAVVDALWSLERATDEEIEDWVRHNWPMAMSPSGLRTRRKELERLGFVRKAYQPLGEAAPDSYYVIPLRRRTQSGCFAQVWELTPNEGEE